MPESIFNLTHQGKLNELKELIAKEPNALDRQEERTGRTPLLIAARRGQLHCVQWLIEHGANISRVDKRGKGLLYNLVRSVEDCDQESASKVPETFRWIIDYQKAKGAEINLAKHLEDGSTILHVVAENNNETIFCDLVRLQPTLLKIYNSEGRLPIHLLVEKNHLDLLKVCRFTLKLHFKGRTKEGDSVMHLAVRYGTLETAEFLAATDPSLLDNLNRAGATPCLVAAAAGRLDMVRWLDRYQVDLFVKDKTQQRNVLHYLASASALCNKDYAIKWIENKEAEKIKGKYQKEKIHSVDYINLLGYLQTRLGEKAFGEMLHQGEKRRNWTPWLTAATAGDVKILSTLLSHDFFQKEVKDSHGRSALHLAVSYGRIDAVDWLCKTHQELVRNSSSRNANLLHRVLESRKMVSEESRYRLVCYFAKHHADFNKQRRRYALFSKTAFGIAKRLSKQNPFMSEIMKVLKMSPTKIPDFRAELDPPVQKALKALAPKRRSGSSVSGVSVINHSPDIAQVSREEFSIFERPCLNIPEDLYGQYYHGTWIETDEFNPAKPLLVRVLEMDHGMSDGELRKLYHELSILSRFHHSNILKVYGYHIEGKKKAYLLMQEADVGSLAHVFLGNDPIHTDQALSCELRLRLAKEVCAGLVHAHERRIWHRNLTPSSVLLNSQWRAKVTNFGMAKMDTYTKMTTFSAGISADNNTLESLASKAPELLLAQDGKARHTEKSDVYAFGMLCYVLLTRQAPVSVLGGDETKILQSIQDGQQPTIPSVSDFPSDHPTAQLLELGFDKIIRNCWRENPNERPTMSILLEKLNHLSSSLEGIYDMPEGVQLPSSPLPDEEDEERAPKTVSRPSFYHLRFQPVLRDGHCLFHSIGLYLGEDADFLRRIVAVHLEANFEEFKVFRAGTDDEFRAYIEAIRGADEWGDHIEIEIIQRITDRPIIIIRPDVNPVLPDNLENFSGEPIFLYYNGHTHYDAFILEEGADASKILNDMRADMAQGRLVRYFPVAQFQEYSQDEGNLTDATDASESDFPESEDDEPRPVSSNNHYAALSSGGQALFGRGYEYMQMVSPESRASAASADDDPVIDYRASIVSEDPSFRFGSH